MHCFIRARKKEMGINAVTFQMFYNRKMSAKEIMLHCPYYNKLVMSTSDYKHSGQPLPSFRRDMQSRKKN